MKSIIPFRFVVYCMLLFLVMQSSIHLNGQCYDISLVCDTCPCIALYAPVIGCDGKVYGNSCEAQNSGIVYYLSYLDIVSIEGPTELEKGDSAVLYVQHTSADPTYISYEWNNGDSGQEITVYPDSTFEYTVHISVTYNFENGSSFFNESDYSKLVNVIEKQSGTDLISTPKEIKVYPIPADKMVQIAADRQIDFVQIVDSKGMVVIDKIVNSRNTLIDVSTLLPGIYFAKIRSIGSVSIKKLMVE